MLGFDVTHRYGDQAAFLSAGGYHHHIALNTWEARRLAAAARHDRPLPRRDPLPRPRALADALRRVLEARRPAQGASDHGVSEAIYLRDPDGNGVELYRDRPRDQWPQDMYDGPARPAGAPRRSRLVRYT